MTESTFSGSAGAAEGKVQLALAVSAVDPDGNRAAFRHPEKGADLHVTGQTTGMNRLIETYAVAAGDTFDVEVCLEYTEQDDRGFDTVGDTASLCTPVTLACDQAIGHLTQNVDLGPAPLCDASHCKGEVSAQLQVIRADADDDGVANETDLTPDVCDEYEKGNQGVGLIVYFHYGDEKFVTAAQSLFLEIDRVFASYDQVALLVDNQHSNPLGINHQAVRNADRVYPPTRDGFQDAVQYMTSTGFRFDVFTFSHGAKRGPHDSAFVTLDNAPCISGKWLERTFASPEVAGTPEGGVPIVVWWSTTCFGGRQVDAWQRIGAIASSGSVDVYFYPTTWKRFSQRWPTGKHGYHELVENSLRCTDKTLAVALMGQQSLEAPYGCEAAGLDDEECCRPGDVARKTACAEDFFNDDVGRNEARYDIREVYDHGERGARNMAIASERTFAGDGAVTFGASGLDPWP